MEIKICKKCSKQFSASAEFFYKGGDGKLITRCKECIKHERSIYYKNNRDKILKYTNEYKQQNKERVIKRNREYKERNREYIRDYRSKNIEKIRDYKREYRKVNKEKTKKHDGNYYKRNRDKIVDGVKSYYLKNKEKILDGKKEYYKKNKNKIFERVKIWRQNNIEKVSCQSRKKKHKRNAFIKRLPAFYAIEEWQSCKEYFNNTCCYCGKKSALEQEHFIPLTRGGEYTHNNIVCACKSCNSSKGGNDPFSWYRQQECYSNAQEKKILKFLNYKKGIQQLVLF